ncbi:hypothetical protein M405DRAFT_806263 [Rhizopogon salebrosus TDB-379]|nr:hypothetical protein M405DRAFT_806263 [Rhizopogon salebrosus TDB-379]
MCGVVTEDKYFFAVVVACDSKQCVRQGRGNYVLRTGTSTTSGKTASDDNEPVTLSAVVRISSNDYFFTADGFYRGPSRFTSSLADKNVTYNLLKLTLLRWPQIWNGYEMPYLRQEIRKTYTSEILPYSFRGEVSPWLINVHG